MTDNRKKKRRFGFFGSQRSVGGKPAASQPVLPKAPEPALANRVQLCEGDMFQILLDGSPHEEIVVPEEIAAKQVKIAEGRAVLELSGGDQAAVSWGRTGGFSIRVPDTIEAAASGKRVRVTVNARAADGKAAEFSLAYSTNDVGNSGWNKFAASDEFQPKSLEYDVPTMKNGNGDFVGILPQPGPGVQVEMLKVEVIPRS